MEFRRLAPRLALTVPLVVAFVLGRVARLDQLAAFAAAGLALLAVGPSLPSLRARAGFGAGLGALLGTLLLAAPGGLAAALQALPLVLEACLALHFAASLRQGREPLIALYTRLDWGHVPPECAGYTRRLTQLWSVVLAALAAAHGLTFALPDLDPGLALAANAAVVLALFLGEHLVRTLRFPQFGIASPLRTFRAILLAAGTEAGAVRTPAVTRHAG